VEELGLPAAASTGPSFVPDPLFASLPAGEAVDIARISNDSGLTAAQLLPRLLDLELQGLIRRAPGGRFIRVGKSC
jgi:predicted Rossmann fold nucleotide-binding protein DprA/Smf involved in DNA uptake